MEPTTKKYLIGGAALVGGYLIYLRAKHNAKAEKDSKSKPAKTPGLPAASTSGQFTPVGLPPSSGYPYPAAPSYIPPGPGYIPPSYPSYPGYIPPAYPGVTYPGQYPNNDIGFGPYPGTGPYPQSPYPSTTGQAACSAVVGLVSSVAIQRLRGLGIYAQVVSINGVPQHTTALATGGPTAALYLQGGRVSNAICSGTAAYPATYGAYGGYGNAQTAYLPNGYNY